MEKVKVGKTYLVDVEPRVDKPSIWEEMTFLYETPRSIVFERKDGTLYATQLVAFDGKTALVKEIK